MALNNETLVLLLDPRPIFHLQRTLEETDIEVKKRDLILYHVRASQRQFKYSGNQGGYI